MPFLVVIFQHGSQIGFFDAKFHKLGFFWDSWRQKKLFGFFFSIFGFFGDSWHILSDRCFDFLNMLVKSVIRLFLPVSVLLAGMSEISLRSKRIIFCEITRFYGKFDFVNTHVGEQHPPEKNHEKLHLSKPTVIDWCGFLREVSEVFISTFLNSYS